MDAETAAPPGRRSAPHEDPAFRVFIDSLSYLKPDEVALRPYIIYCQLSSTKSNTDITLAGPSSQTTAIQLKINGV